MIVIKNFEEFMEWFLSEESIALHKEYVRDLKLRYSILEKSIDGIKGKNCNEILSLRLERDCARDIMMLLPEIELHNMFFSSFSINANNTSSVVRKQYGNESEFLSEMYKAGMSLNHGFLAVLQNRSKLEILPVFDYFDVVGKGRLVIALDICEHVYFSDYGFNKKAYLINAIRYLNLSRIDLTKNIN